MGEPVMRVTVEGMDVDMKPRLKTLLVGVLLTSSLAGALPAAGVATARAAVPARANAQATGHGAPRAVGAMAGRTGVRSPWATPALAGASAARAALPRAHAGPRPAVPGPRDIVVGPGPTPPTNCNTGCGRVYYAQTGDLWSTAPVARIDASVPPRRVTTSGNATSNVRPMVSPDGNTLVYLSRAGIIVAPLTGEAERQVVPTRSGMDLYDPTWSPDGQYIAYGYQDYSQGFPGVYGIGVVRATDAPSVATYPNGAHVRNGPTWSPDGRTIVVSEDQPDASGDHYALASIDVASGVSMTLVADPDHNYLDPVFSPDGQSIASVQAGRTDASAANLWVTAADGSGGRAVTTGVDRFAPAWSPDGTALAYAANMGQYTIPLAPSGRPIFVGTGDAPPGESLTWSGVGASAARVTPTPFTPATPPANCNIGCGRLYFQRGNDIYSALTDGSGAAQLTSSGTADMANVHPAVSPDGNSLAYQHGVGVAEIYVQPVAGGTALTVNRGPYARDPAWSPDGRDVAYDYVDAYYQDQYDALIVSQVADGAQVVTYSPRFQFALYPTWSPDRGAIVVSRGDASVNTLALVAIDAYNLSDHPLTNDAGHSYNHPIYSPDGRQLACIQADSATSHSGSLWVMNADGSGGHAVLAGVDDSQPAWSPDGAMIAYTQGNALYAVPTAGGAPTLLVADASNPAWSGAGGSAPSTETPVPATSTPPPPMTTPPTNTPIPTSAPANTPVPTSAPKNTIVPVATPTSPAGSTETATALPVGTTGAAPGQATLAHGQATSTSTPQRAAPPPPSQPTAAPQPVATTAPQPTPTRPRSASFAVGVRVPGGLVTRNSVVTVTTKIQPRARISITVKLTAPAASYRTVVAYIRVGATGAPGPSSTAGTKATACHKGVRGCVARRVVRRVVRAAMLYGTVVRARADARGRVSVTIRLLYVPRARGQATLAVTAVTARGTATSSNRVTLVPLSRMDGHTTQ